MFSSSGGANRVRVVGLWEPLQPKSFSKQAWQ